jgi:uncharacterized membrane protein HdeD (DUF308 family)
MPTPTPGTNPELSGGVRSKRPSPFAQLRGIILIFFGVLALYRGFTAHTGNRAWLLPALGLAALALGLTHILFQNRSRS